MNVFVGVAVAFLLVWVLTTAWQVAMEGYGFLDCVWEGLVCAVCIVLAGGALLGIAGAVMYATGAHP